MAAILSQYSATGFYKAPVSKGLLGCIFLTSCAMNVPLLAHIRPFVIYSISDIFEKLQVWKILASKVAFIDTKDLVCGSLLIYYFRIFERRYGSHKFSSYLLAAFTVATILETATVYVLKQLDFPISYLPSGPYGLVFPFFVNYFMDIPRVANTYIMGIPVTGKTLTYLLGLQAISASKGSMICGLCGLLAGVICRWNFFRVRNIVQIPKFLAKFSNVAFGWVLQSSPPQEGVFPMGATLEIQRQQQVELLEQQMLLTRAREMREHADFRGRQQMGQGYAERLVLPPGGGGGLFGFPTGNAFENMMNLRRRNFENANPIIPQRNSDNSSPIVPDNQAGPSVPEEQVQTLVEMGFERRNVIRALQNSNNDINLATTLLLNES